MTLTWVVIAAICVALTGLIISMHSSFREDCLKAGGEPVVIRGEGICLTPGAVIKP